LQNIELRGIGCRIWRSELVVTGTWRDFDCRTDNRLGCDRCSEIFCSFKKSGADGMITLAVSAAGRQEGQLSAPIKFGGVRSELVRTLEAQFTLFMTY
jgi:hypothetical protein